MIIAAVVLTGYMIALYQRNECWIYICGFVLQAVFILMSVYSAYIMCLEHTADLYDAKDTTKGEIII